MLPLRHPPRLSLSRALRLTTIRRGTTTPSHRRPHLATAAAGNHTCGGRRVMTTRCLGVRTDEHGNSALITQEPPQPLAETCRRVHARVQEFLSKEYAEGERLKDVQAQTRRSLGVIREALERYSLDELSLSYNGGKDCLVLLILYLCALHSHHQQRSTTTAFPSALATVYIPPPAPFPAVDAFIASSSRTYHLTLSRHPHPMKSAFAAYLAQHPHIRAIFVGTRRTDPHGEHLTAFDATDRGWPAFMRVHPVVEWHYAEIWAFIRELEVPYCAVYDEGYTSLGGVADTWPNPRLKVEGRAGVYRPAYELVEDEEERLGRDR